MISWLVYREIAGVLAVGFLAGTVHVAGKVHVAAGLAADRVSSAAIRARAMPVLIVRAMPGHGRCPR
jgi:hypothetical protein